MSRREKIAVSVLLGFAFLLFLMAAPDWSARDDLDGSTGPRNAGRFLILVFVLPLDLLLAAGIAYTKAGLRRLFLYGSYAFGGLMALWIGAAMILSITYRFS